MEIIRLASVDSTNLHAFRLIDAGDAKDHLIIWAGEQTEGKGQRNNSWYSEKDRNLTFSIILKPSSIGQCEQPYISKATALGVADYTGLFNSHVSVKWPNDIFVDDKKISGILIECSWKGSQVEWMVLGIGFNLNQDIFPSNLKNPVSLKMLTGIVFNPEESLRLLANSVMARVQQVIRKEFEMIDDQFEKQLYGLGRTGLFDTPKGKLRATIKGVNSKGHLMVELPDGKTKELTFPAARLQSLEKF